MATNKSDDQKLADQANELYWRSGQSVNQIAETMDLSKSGLYALIRPLPAKRACPECGEGLVFLNRTTEQKTIGCCPECGYEGEAPEAGSETRPPGSEARPPKRPPKKRAPRRTTRTAKPNGKGRSHLETGSDPESGRELEAGADAEAKGDPKTKGHPKPGTDLETTGGGAAVPRTGGRGFKSKRVLWASVLLGVAAGLYVTRRSR